MIEIASHEAEDQDEPLLHTPHSSPTELPPHPSTPYGTFSTPRHRKTPTSTLQPTPPPKFWPHLHKVILLEDIANAVEDLYGFRPSDWQMQVFERVAEGNDAMVIAGTGYGKSLVFVLLAIAAALAGGNGVVIVISPLKTLQKDQVRRFNEKQVLRTRGTEGGQPYHVTAVSVNEDNKDGSVFAKIRKGDYRLVFASPEILLHHVEFKQLFQDALFCARIIAMTLDEMHVIKEWKDYFRKAYGELRILKVLAGIEIPWVGLTGTCSTKTFEIIYTTLVMGGAQPFYGIYMGANRLNLKLIVCPMEHSMASMRDLFAFIQSEPTSCNLFIKTLVYLKMRQQARQACDICRILVAKEYEDIMYPLTATSSEEFKDEVMKQFLDGDVRILFVTMAVGMGTDVPDIEQVIIFRVEGLSSAYQKGGHAGRSSTIEASMIWLVEPWAFKPIANSSDTDQDPKKKTKKMVADKERRHTLDSASLEFINRAQSGLCQRTFLCNHFHPQPNLPGFKSNSKGEDSATTNSGVVVEWVVGQVVNDHIDETLSCQSCSALMCRVDPNTAVGPLTSAECNLIDFHTAKINGRAFTQLNTTTILEPARISMIEDNKIKLRCEAAERTVFREALVFWRDAAWKRIEDNNPFLSCDWVMTKSNIEHLIDKAHVILNFTEVNIAEIQHLITWILLDDDIVSSLIVVLEQFREAHMKNSKPHAAERKWK
ncbi:P-loop containing nucleoside triphosphate hydrolase protein [Cyathus striatus]|nr:P-loop containing nucleoside triphosphate hydrolase protein [Cyathus striatus]